jgi:hypothetical protein
MQTQRGNFPPPPGLIASIASGFDTVATHVLIITLPVVLDLFLWLGPRLQVKQLMQSFLQSLPTVAASLPGSPTDPAVLVTQVTDFINRFNLFSALRTYPVGISSLMSAQMPAQTPLGNPAVMDAGSFLKVAALWILLAVAGWLAGGLYYFWVSRVALKLEGPSLLHSLGQTVLLSTIWLVLLAVAGVPAFFMFSAVALISPVVAQIVFFLLALFSLWLLMPIFFSPHGIFTFQQDAFQAILNSLRMMRFTLPNTGLFLLAFIIISQGLDFLWRTPAENNWLMMVGIVGHAFISTALLAASFIYYRDIHAWLKVVFEQLKTQATSARV